MGYWFIDPIRGDDANDGRASMAFSDSVGFSRDEVALSSAGLFVDTVVGDVLWVISGESHAWFLVLRNGETTVYGWLLDEVGVIGSGTVQLGGAGSGPVRTYSRLTALAAEADICHRREPGGLRRVNRQGTSDNIDPRTGENLKKVFPQGVPNAAPGDDPFSLLSMSQQEYEAATAAASEQERVDEQRRAGASRERRFHLP